uniref:NADH-ubiquinone oxidoreductase chain 5 n=1 Tax=Cirroteuthis muelleri TaxID=202430 RepID=A0A9E9FWN5_9MOLL|nr:NADH dehydrogenase subunit 5 [Cirroteuthis muelleri]WAP91416.1 NADH dehydrogenase subunit 5 [Cirroteuthis muelleri]
MMNFLKLEMLYSLFLFLWSSFMFLIFLFMSLNDFSYIVSWEVFSFMSVFVEFDVVVDWISCSFSGLVCMISGCVLIFSISYMKEDSNGNRFIMILMLFVLSMNFLVFVPSLVSLILGWDGLGLVSFCLVIYYQNNKSLSAGMLTVLMNRIGDCFILGSISIMISLGHWNLLCLWDFNLLWLCMIFLVIAGMTKSAQIPFSSWLPAAMAAPTPVSALVHSSTLVTAGVFLIIRFYPYLIKFDLFFPIMVYISVITTFMSGISAINEYDMKKIIALSTLSQLGVMMLSLGLGMPMLALFHLYTHAMFKALLFMCGGNIIHCYMGNQDMRSISGVSVKMPFTSMCLNVSNMALCGFPFLAGFYSKDLIIEKMLSSGINLLMMILGLVGVCLTVFYSMRLSFYMIWNSEIKGSYNNICDDDVYMFVSMCILVSWTLWGGFIFQMIFMQFNEEIFLPSFYKLLITILIMFSLGLSMGIWVFYFKMKKINFVLFFNSMMWFMPSLSTYPFMLLMMKTSNFNLKLVDMGWMEKFGGQGVFKLNSLFLKMMEHWMLLLFNVYLIIVIMFIIMV